MFGYRHSVKRFGTRALPTSITTPGLSLGVQIGLTYLGGLTFFVALTI